MEPILKVQDLHTEIQTDYGTFEAVSGVSFELEKGETLGLVGESGCGKSLTSLSITGLLGPKVRVAGGQAMFEGRDILHLPEKEKRALRGGEIAMIFQEPMTALNPLFTIGNQMVEMMLPHMKITKKEAMERAVKLLSDMGIERPERIIKSYPFQLSGGMLQRVMIAMSLSCNPKILIADEPTTALDVTIQAQILKLMNELKEKYDTSIILITHNLGVVAQVCDRVAVMYFGKIVETASVKELFERPLHPYTRGLMGCIPKLDRDEALLNTIPGMVPAVTEQPKGCSFAPRCPQCMDRCLREEPELTKITAGHGCRCFYVQEGGR
ncbi:MAG: ABC transporter ATP-binding protein [Eubacteriales bacterium]|nr:ABC transporter ATP-binding protein [Eubacteriales bacterium]